ncbi:MAG: hypothetical protein AVO33_07235 [delta proteobacterium ML8_F1]|nr:MAG: hypothetical protein AVO33_07235 [delta proteobacterium ML8_F1]
MKDIYNQEFSATHLFQENAYQKIYMGESIKHSDQVVLINELIKSDLITHEVISDLRAHLDHLLFFTEDDRSATFIIDYKEGMSVTQALQNNQNPAKFRINLLQDYLSKLSRFDTLPLVLQYILSSPSQFFVKDHDLIHNELIVIDESKAMMPMDFGMIKARIHEFATHLLDFEPAPEDLPLVLTLKEFFDNLITDDSIDTLAAIYESFKKIYLYDFYLDDSDPEPPVIVPLEEKASPTGDKTDGGRNIPVYPEPGTPTEDEKKPFALAGLFNRNPPDEEKEGPNPLVLGLVLLAVAIALFAIFIPMINRITDVPPPTASFEKQKDTEGNWVFTNRSEAYGEDNRIEDFDWSVYEGEKKIYSASSENYIHYFNEEGVYRIDLKVRDRYDNWSEVYSEEILEERTSTDPLAESSSGEESLDRYAIGMEDGVTFIQEESRSGDKSIAMVFEGSQTRTITLENQNLAGNIGFSFWMKGSESVPLSFTLKGVTDDEEIFSIDRFYTPKTEEWQKISFNDNVYLSRDLVLSVSGRDLTLWIDDISISTYK